MSIFAFTFTMSLLPKRPFGAAQRACLDDWRRSRTFFLIAVSLFELLSGCAMLSGSDTQQRRRAATQPRLNLGEVLIWQDEACAELGESRRASPRPLGLLSGLFFQSGDPLSLTTMQTEENTDHGVGYLQDQRLLAPTPPLKDEQYESYGFVQARRLLPLPRVGL